MDKQHRTFICPRCGKHETFENSSICGVIVEEEFKDVIPNKMQITQRYYKVRFCLSCEAKRTVLRSCRHLAALITPALIVYVFTRNIGQCFAWGFLSIMFLYIPSVHLYRKIVGKSKSTRRLIMRAKEGNAIVR